MNDQKKVSGFRLRKRGNGPFSIRHGATVSLFLKLYPFLPFLSYHTVALTTPIPLFTSMQRHCDAPLAYKRPHMLNNHAQEQSNLYQTVLDLWTAKWGRLLSTTTSLTLLWKVKKAQRSMPAISEGDVAEECTFSGVEQSSKREKKKLLSGLSALLKLILALCMVLYLFKFISPSFLLPKLKSPNKDLLHPPIKK